MLTSIVGTNWGDEGKGRIVDLLSEGYDIVSRYQGGNNAGHTVVNEKGSFILNLIPSGIFRDGTVCHMGPGMVVDLEHLNKEIADIESKGVDITSENLKISDRATVCMPYHKLQDILEEERLADKKFGSTRSGIAPVYADKYMKKTLRMGDLFDSAKTKEKLNDIVEWKNLTIEKGYGHEAIDPVEMYDWVMKYGEPMLDNIINSTDYLTEAAASGKNIMFEAQLGALRDIDYGIYPYTSSSSTISGYAPIGAGIPGLKLDCVIGITKAYSSCVGEGPFTCELFGEEGDKLRELGGEYGARTGRPRRVGGFDVPASRFGVQVQGCTEIALTKLDILSDYENIPVCEAYELDGEVIDYFPTGERLNRAKPVYTTVKGWNCDISGCKNKEDLPAQAFEYIKYIESAVKCKIKYVSVGPEREQYIDMDK